MYVVLVRHTTVGVKKGTCYGWSDVPLAKTFIEEAQEVKAKLDEYPMFDKAFSSPLQRAKDLAIYCGFKDIETDNRLKEMYMGDWEMKKYNEITDPYLQKWYENYKTLPTKNGESFVDLLNRVGEFLDYLKTQNYKNVVIFTHSGVIMCALIYAKIATISNCWDYSVEYGGIKTIEI